MNQPHMNQSLTKLAVVTGGSRGIGRAISLELARAGLDVVINFANNPGPAESLQTEIEALGRRAILAKGNVASETGRASIVDTVTRAGSALSVLVNNAGVFAAGGVSDTAAQDFDRVFTANTRGAFFLSQALLGNIVDGGRIITISSTAARTGEPGFTAYSMSKAAMESFTKALAKEAGPRGITVNAIAPGWIETDLNRDFWRDNPGVPNAAAEITALRRTGNPSDVAGVAAFLASDAASFVTGTVLEASGGYAL